MQVSAACIRCMVERQEERMQKKTGVSEIKKSRISKTSSSRNRRK